MHPYKLGEMEQRFADLIWENAPVASGELVKLCGSAFDWKTSRVPCRFFWRPFPAGES